MDREEWASNLFKSIDRQDTESFLAFLTDDIVFQFGNADPVEGKSSVRDVVAGFFSSIKGSQHELTQLWDENDAVICHGTVTYTRHDTSTLTVPFANILKLNSNLIKEYLIYVDVSELYKTA